MATLILLMVTLWSAGADLSPAIQADLYLVQTEEYMKEKDYTAAREAMVKLVNLADEHNLKVPDEFYFKYAQVLNLAEEYARRVTRCINTWSAPGAPERTTEKR
ncbi:MAG: hypothetical protein OXQ31_26850 [Spirochaetaceae bacterium]|nr:hypothetical protein [Spirochaetaceae bacterium]